MDFFANKPSFYEIITGHAVNNCGSGGCGGGSWAPWREKIYHHGCGGGCGAMKSTTISSCGGWGGGACGAPTYRPLSSCGGGSSRC